MSDLPAPFKILALDGGGIRGLFSAAVISRLEEHSRARLVDHFDLVVGTSTGSIIALGLAAGLSGREVLAFYEEHGPRIFGKKRRFSQLWRPKFDNEPLTDSLQGVFLQKCLNDLEVPVCVATYEMLNAVPRVLKTDHEEGLHWGGNVLVWKAAVASCAAPMFFKPVTVDRQDLHIDGGIWANNPVLVGITEAKRRFGRELHEISVLSIGTCSNPPRLIPNQSMSWGLADWLRDNRLLDTVMTAQSRAAEYTADLLLGERHRRIDAELSEPVPLDDYERAEHLIERGAQEGRRHLVDVQRDFLAATAAHRPSRFAVGLALRQEQE